MRIPVELRDAEHYLMLLEESMKVHHEWIDKIQVLPCDELLDRLRGLVQFAHQQLKAYIESLDVINAMIDTQTDPSIRLELEKVKKLFEGRICSSEHLCQQIEDLANFVKRQCDHS